MKTAATWSGGSGPCRRISSTRAASAKQAYRRLRPHPLLCHSEGGKSADELLEQYGIEVLVLDGFDRFTGQVHTWPRRSPIPHRPNGSWCRPMNRSMVFMRQPPPGVQPLNSLRSAAEHRTQCRQQIEHDPLSPACAKGIADLYTLIGEKARASQWMAYYESRSH